MTSEQWDSINASLNSLRVLLFALAKTSPNDAALRQVFRQERETLETFALNSKLPDSSIEEHRKKLDELEKAIWG